MDNADSVSGTREELGNDDEHTRHADSVSGTRDEELGNDDEHTRHHMYLVRNMYVFGLNANAMIHVHPQNIKRRRNIGHTTLPLSNVDVTTPLEGNQRSEISLGEWFAGVGLYLAINVALLGFAPLKFRGASDFPFKTHLAFIIMPIASFFTAVFTSWIVVYTNNHLRSLIPEHFHHFYDLVTKTLLWFSAILTPLSGLLLLFLPKKYNLVGHLIVGALFVVILASNSIYILTRIRASRRVLAAFERV